ncbi:hypothetical protein HOLleu_14495 [Holothuria leucospilota]|uniref:Tyrosine-protein kinase ephrin type A/B receptor-like domain-containing protein n=1 Tax=Holothuria leucospilota TaxID=206669 RepID=A0A9Q1HBR8_HOLLE|nr:hypothetical protein HOLleu_14495 [Holothuria leucospilota]
MPWVKSLKVGLFNFNRSCVTSSYVTTLLVYNDRLTDTLPERGFNCTKEASYLRTSNCTSCVVGTYGNRIQGQCLPCPRGGFYQDEVGQYQSNSSDIGCKLCNRGTFVMHGGGNSSLSCKVCPEGTNKTEHASYRACFCLENYFRRDRFGKCYLCPQEGLKCSSDYVTIQPGYYWKWSGPHLNLYERYVENLLTFSDTYDTSTSTFTETFPKVHKCPQPFKCTNNDTIKGDCEEGYRGWLCTKCQEGYFPVIGFCQECPSLWIFIGEIAAFVLVAVCFVLYVIYTYRRERQLNQRSIVDVALARGKIVLGFYQIMGEFWDSLDTVHWPYIFRQLADWMRIVQFNLAVLVVKPCCFFPKINLSPYEMFVIGVSVPSITVVFSLVTIVMFYVRLWYLKQYDINFSVWNLKIESWKDRILTVALLVLYVTYPSTSNAIFALYPPACDMFYLDEENTSNVSLLRSDYSIDCKSDVHRKYVNAAYFASLYVIVFPCSLFYLLRRYSKAETITDITDGDRYPVWLRFLCENYKDRFWFWEIIELTRKVSQTFIIILFGWNSPLSVTTTLTLSVIFLTLHASYAPMRDKFEHYLQVGFTLNAFKMK